MVVEMDDFLEHHGVLGMHWGSHKGGGAGAAKSSSSRPAPMSRGERKVARAQGKIARVTEKTNAINERDQHIMNARANVGKTAQRLKLAKTEYKLNKLTMDKHAAKAELGKHKAAHAANVHDASLMTSQEAVTARNEAIRTALVGAAR